MGAERITICHWNEGGRWEAIEIDNNAIGGHTRHEMDIWPPVPEITDGNNWPIGQSVYLNGCSIVASVEPTQSPAPSPSLPSSGAQDVGVLLLVATALIAIGIYLLIRKD